MALSLIGRDSAAEPTLDPNHAASQNNAFAVDLYKQLARKPGNLVVSPFSIDVALMMAYAGAGGRTAQQMAQVLHLSEAGTNISTELGALQEALNRIDTNGNQFISATSLWAHKGFPVYSSYQQFLVRNYSTELYTEDFGSGHDSDLKVAEQKAAEARRKVNQWFAKRTHDKIKDVVDSRFKPGTKLLLADAVYFKGLWEFPFDKKLTENAPFWIGNRESMPVPTMHLTASFKHSQTPDLQLLEMPYSSDRLSMFLLLPNRRDGLRGLEKTLTAPALNQLLQANPVHEVCVHLPRFKETTSLELRNALSDLGMKDAFVSLSANFLRMADDPELFIYAVVHKATVETAEEGTEAAAGTIVGLTDSAEPIPVFNADHPFLFLVVDNPTGAILLMGRVTNPLQ